MTSPVSTWENEKVKGAALCCTRTLNRGRAEVEKLRARQAEYLASLPTEPKEVISAALKEMHLNGESYPGAFEEAMHLSKALRPMIEHSDTDEPGPDRDALLWIADRIMFGLERTARNLDHISEILGNPRRIEREGEA